MQRRADIVPDNGWSRSIHGSSIKLNDRHQPTRSASRAVSAGIQLLDSLSDRSRHLPRYSLVEISSVCVILTRVNSSVVWLAWALSGPLFNCRLILIQNMAFFFFVFRRTPASRCIHSIPAESTLLSALKCEQVGRGQELGAKNGSSPPGMSR